MTEDKKDKSSGFRVTNARKVELKKIVADRGTSVQQLIEDALDAFLGQDPDKYRGKHAEDVGALVDILDNGEETDRLLIKEILKRFREHIARETTRRAK